MFVEFQLIVVAFIAGVLTILAPCIFPLLPILLGTSTDKSENRNRAITVIVSLLVSIAVLTVALYGTSNALGIDQGVLRGISASILMIIGLFMVFPKVWENISQKFGLSTNSNKLLGKAMSKNGRTRDVLIGASLGPVFSSCSPTYGLIIATILPVNFTTGLMYLLWYLLGLGIMFLLIAILGQKFVSKLSWATDPDGWFKRIIGILFVLIGVSIIFGWDKDFEILLLELDFYDSLVNFELNLQ
jgi:cytochrome c biogenesis protein CcdA